MPTCRTEMIFISNLRATFCAKHDFKVTKRMHAIKLLCKNIVETFNSKDFFSALLTKYFLILKQFSRFRNIFLDFKFFFLDFINFFFWLWSIFVDSKIFSWLWKFFLDFISFFSMAAIGHHKNEIPPLNSLKPFVTKKNIRDINSNQKQPSWVFCSKGCS